MYVRLLVPLLFSDEVFTTAEAGVAFRAYVYFVGLQVRAISCKCLKTGERFYTRYLLKVTSSVELLTALRTTIFIKRSVIGLMSRLVLL